MLTTERSWDFFAESSAGNLKFLELLYLQDQSNTSLLPILTKGFAGYAYGVSETLYFGEKLLGDEDTLNKQNALQYYTRALDYGLEYLDRQGIKRKDLLELEDKQLIEKLDKKLGEEDFIAVLYTGQAWGSLINLQMDNIALVTQVPRVKILFDWVCKKDSKIENGVCDIFYAQYEASRPKMLGGDPKKAEELYLAAIKAWPQHLLVRLNYIQFLILPGFEQDKYESQAKVLKEEFAKWEDMNRDNLENQNEYRKSSALNLYNAIAKKRFLMIEKNKAKIF